MTTFECRTFGKWILAGEHAVLRGCPALVFPIKDKCVQMMYSKGSEALQVEFLGSHGEELRLLFWGVIENAVEQLKIPRSELRGKLSIFSDLPVGAGLGASAALCVAVARWCHFHGWLHGWLGGEDCIYEFARGLENLFHGESSGVDIAVALSGEGLKFVRGGQRSPIHMAWQPIWRLSYSGHRGVTSECVNKVKSLFQSNEKLALSLDRQMREAVDMAEDALMNDSQKGFLQLRTAIMLARDCFERWGLCEDSLRRHLKSVEEAGAVAAKPTGSGGGGYVLSLWEGPTRTSLFIS